MSTTLARHLVGMDPKSTRQDGDVPQAWWYRGADSVTLYQRIAGRDAKVCRVAIESLTAGGAHATEAMRNARHAARELVNRVATEAAQSPVPPRGRGRPAGQVAANATWADVWAEFRREVERHHKWGARTASQNDYRIERHLAGRDADEAAGEEAIERHPLWAKPMRNTTGSDVAAVLAPLRATKPGEEHKLRGLLNLVVATGWTKGALAEGSHPVRDALAMIRATTKRAPKKRLAATTDIPALRVIVQRIQAEIPGAQVLRDALTLQAFTGHRSDRIMRARLEHFHPPKDGKPWRWVTPRKFMKTKDAAGMVWDHELWLPPQVVALLERQPTWKDRAKGGWLFPGRTGASRCGHITNLDGPMRELLGKGKHTPHGWRSAIKTNAQGQVVMHNGTPLPRFDRSWIQAVTDHKPEGIDEHYVREAAVQGGAHVLAWWCAELTGTAQQRKRGT
jgi:hypothetical protein